MRTPGRGRKLLAGQRPQPGARRRLRPVQRDLLPHPVRRGRDLEPGLHAVQPRRVRRRTISVRCPARTSTPAWAWSGRPRCCRAWKRTSTSTSCAAGRGGRRGVRSSPTSRRARPGAACGGSPTTSAPAPSPSTRTSIPAQETGLRHQAALAPRRAGRPPDGRPRAVPPQAGRQGGRTDEEPYPELARPSRAWPRSSRSRRGELPGHHRRGPGSHRADVPADEAWSTGHGLRRRGGRDVPTHGFPPELFETMAAERNLLFDWKGFREEMEQHGIDSGGGKKVELFQPRSAGRLWSRPCTAAVPRLRHARAKRTPRSSASSPTTSLRLGRRGRPRAAVVVVLDKTPFYGEMGGQVGDVGEIVRGRAIPLRGDRHDQVEHGFIQHRGHLRQGSLALGARVTARVDEARRQGIRRAHSATHLLHYALHEHVGKHALQQGSKVDDDLLRFDFANPKGRHRRAVGRRSRTRSTAWMMAGDGHLQEPAAGRGPQARGHDALRREVSRRGPRGFDGPVSARSFAAARTWRTRGRSGC
jgi:hypothetical protein